MYQILVKFGESRNSPVVGPLSYPSAEARLDAAMGPKVYWYHFVEDDDWFSWRRGGAWEATAPEVPADRINVPPEITEDDRW